MSEKKKKILSFGIIAAAVILVLLFALYLITKAFAVSVILYVYLHLLFVPLNLGLMQKCFRNQLTKSMNKVLALCGGAIVLDLVVVDAFRYILSGGISTVFFLPACLPVCFMIIVFYSNKDMGQDEKAEKKLTYIVGIPLLLLSLYIEVLSFVQM